MKVALAIGPLGYAASFCAIGIFHQFHIFVPADRLSVRSVWLIAFTAMDRDVMGLLVVAKCWAFPILFTRISGTPSLYLVPEIILQK